MDWYSEKGEYYCGGNVDKDRCLLSEVLVADKPAPTYQERHAQWVKEAGIKVGDSVRILRGFESCEDGFECSMGSIPRENIGKTGYVKHLGGSSILVNQYGTTWEWPYFCLEVIKPTYRPYTMAEAEELLLGAKVRRKDSGRACLCNLDGAPERYFNEYTYLDGSPCGMQETPQES